MTKQARYYCFTRMTDDWFISGMRFMKEYTSNNGYGIRNYGIDDDSE